MCLTATHKQHLASLPTFQLILFAEALPSPQIVRRLQHNKSAPYSSALSDPSPAKNCRPTQNVYAQLLLEFFFRDTVSSYGSHNSGPMRPGRRCRPLARTTRRQQRSDTTWQKTTGRLSSPLHIRTSFKLHKEATPPSRTIMRRFININLCSVHAQARLTLPYSSHGSSVLQSLVVNEGLRAPWPEPQP
jgi:hypothetical protein